MKFLRFLLCLALIILTFCMFGCTVAPSTDDPDTDPVPVEIDIDALASELLSSLKIEDSVEKVDTFVISSLYGIEQDEVKDCVVYMSTGAKADEIAVFEVLTPEFASELAGIFEDRKEDQINIFKDYAPEEVSKLKSSVIYSDDRYAVYCVSPDNKRAREIIDSYF